MALKKIINITELARMAGRHPTRLSRYVREGRLKGDYVDTEGVYYWNPSSAARIVRIIKEHEASGKVGRGSSIDFEPRAKRDRKGK